MEMVDILAHEVMSKNINYNYIIYLFSFQKKSFDSEAWPYDSQNLH